MRTAIFRLAEKPDQISTELVSELNAALSGTGCMIFFNDACTDLHLTYDEAQYAEYKRRGAGRRRKLLKDYQRVTVGEVRTMLKSKTAEEVSSELGVSRSTLFRRIKGKDDRSSF